MTLIIPAVLPRDEAIALGKALRGADWLDGHTTAGPAAVQVKRNRQLTEDGATAVEARKRVQTALSTNALFLSAALPARILPPMFNLYGEGDGYGAHVDNAIRSIGSERLRTDLSATLFLSDPGDYDGGELLIDEGAGRPGHKLPAGDLLLYPASTLHLVNPVTRGERLASFFWIQSMVREEAARATLFELDQSIQTLAAERGGSDAQVLRLTNIYHNLVRRWADP